MNRSQRAGAGLVKKVFAGKGGYTVRHPGAGEHVEVPLSKQVLVFAKGDKPFAIYPISSGKSSTPTVTGHYQFIRQEPGYNSHGMYYSFYFYGGYAVHGYNSSPRLPRQPRLPADLHRRPARDLQPDPLRRGHLHLVSACDAAHIGVLSRSRAEHATLPASLICLITRSPVTDLAAAQQTLLAELKEHSLILGEVTLASGAVAQYYVDARRTLMRPAGFQGGGGVDRGGGA